VNAKQLCRLDDCERSPIREAVFWCFILTLVLLVNFVKLVTILRSMTVSELASISGYSRQRLNRLVDLGHAHGIRRKPNGRLEVTDKPLAVRWGESLRRRKAVRKQRNLERREKRDRLKVRRMISATPLPHIIGALHPEITASMRYLVIQKLQNEFKGDWQKFDHLIDGFAQTKSREILESILQPIGFQRAAFILLGRRPDTKAARSMLFDFAVNPATTHWIKSFADIARGCDCTRAAVSAMSKQLPMQLPENSGRHHRP
jgi:hypothetical protein